MRGREGRGFLRPLRCFDAPEGVLHLQAHDHQSWPVIAIQKEEGEFLEEENFEVVFMLFLRND